MPADPSRPGGLRAPGHPEAQAWLQAYYQQPEPRPAPAPLAGSACDTRTTSGSSGSGRLRRWLPTQRPRQRRNLVLAPVGADWDASAWLGDPAAATFDVVIIFYGDPSATFSCPLCKEVHRMQGGAAPVPCRVGAVARGSCPAWGRAAARVFSCAPRGWMPLLPPPPQAPGWG